MVFLHPIRAEGRKINNSTLSAVGKTPFQAATQVTCTMFENVTNKKNVMQCFVVTLHWRKCSAEKTAEDYLSRPRRLHRQPSCRFQHRTRKKVDEGVRSLHPAWPQPFYRFTTDRDSVTAKEASEEKKNNNKKNNREPYGNAAFLWIAKETD